MVFSLNTVVPWGRSFDEYILMFSLSSADLNKFILGCGGGPASFNTELTRRGDNVVSIDPVYQFNVDEIRKQIESTYDLVIEETRKNHNEFTWNHIRTVEDLGRIRIVKKVCSSRITKLAF